MPDFIALRGDPSDKLPGAKGIGAVGAAGLIRKYGSLEALLAQAAGPSPGIAAVPQHRDHGCKGAPSQDPRSKADMEKAADLVRSWELKALAERLEKMER